jgi:uncharacterized surface protein with fasciclin (FAS1) repeats
MKLIPDFLGVDSLTNHSIFMKTKLFFVPAKAWTLALFATASLFFFTACNEEEKNDLKSITDTVVESADFTLLEAAVVRAGLADALRQGSLTVFAPTDAAFRAAGFADVAAIQNTPVATLKAVLEYHVLGSRVASTAIQNGDNQANRMLSNLDAFITKNAGGVSINGARVTTPDLGAANGVIHVIDAVIMPPAANVVDIAKGNANLTFLVAAVERAGSAVAGALTAPGPITVFAPTNAAFQQAGFNTIESVRAANPADLAKILTYHVVPARAFATNLSNNSELATAQGQKLKVGINGAIVSITGAANGTNASRVAIANIKATNGVIHVIDRVLLPN